MQQGLDATGNVRSMQHLGPKDVAFIVLTSTWHDVTLVSPQQANQSNAPILTEL